LRKRRGAVAGRREHWDAVLAGGGDRHWGIEIGSPCSHRGSRDTRPSNRTIWVKGRCQRRNDKRRSHRSCLPTTWPATPTSSHVQRLPAPGCVGEVTNEDWPRRKPGTAGTVSQRLSSVDIDDFVRFDLISRGYGVLVHPSCIYTCRRKRQLRSVSISLCGCRV
jgi:hypothetical protein